MKALSGTVCGIKMHLDHYTIKMLFKFVIGSNFLAMSEQLPLTLPLLQTESIHNAIANFQYTTLQLHTL